MIFDKAIHYDVLPQSNMRMKEFLNYNPIHNKYTKKQNIPERNVNETDRGGWRGYDRVYSHFISSHEYDTMNFLEIGIMHGYGMLAWQRFFTNAVVYGIDIKISKKMFVEFEVIGEKFPVFKRTKKLFFDTTNSNDWLSLYGKTFDIIIDDGGHHPHTQIKTFKNAWQKLNSGGFYFIEDVSHRYGKDELIDLSNTLIEYKDKFDFMEIYYHENLGLKKLILSESFLAKNRIKSVDNTREYIVVLKKK
jgi:hypothetical protein